MTKPFITIEQAIADIRQGKMLILVDDASRENEGDLFIPADKVTPEIINFMTKYGRGIVCLPMDNACIDKLNLPLMVTNQQNGSKYCTAYTTSIEAATGVTTGISAYDRAHTIRVAVDPNSTAQDIITPGHIFPLRARENGVLARPGHTEASVDLARLAGFTPAGVICEIMNDDGHMARLADLQQFAKTHQLNIVSINDLIRYRMMHESHVHDAATAHLPLNNYGDFTLKVFVDNLDGKEHLALIRGEISQKNPPLVRIHSECFTGDVLNSSRCDCGWQLATSIEKIAAEGGVLLYLRQEGRGIGLVNKIKAYTLQDEGLDTIEANQQLGFSADARDYGVAAQILRSLEIQQIRLLTNNPQKIEHLNHYGIRVVQRESLQMPPTDKNVAYLQIKQTKLGHLLNII